jgi:hypothetical protein
LGAARRLSSAAAFGRRNSGGDHSNHGWRFPINALQQVTKTVMEAARESLVIGQAWLPANRLRPSKNGVRPRLDRIVFPEILTALLLISAPLILSAAEEISGDVPATEILAAAFPKMTIGKVPRRTIDDSWSMDKMLFFPDALAKEPVYIVSGAPIDDIERCAASDVAPQTASLQRELRMRAYRWPGENDDVLAIVQYRFPDGAPPGSCESIARLFHLDRRGGVLRNKESFLLDSTHHRALNGIQLVDLDGDGTEELVIESDSGGGGIHSSDLVVFSLSKGTFARWLNVPSRLHEWHGKEQEYIQIINVAGTVSEHAQRFCFTKTTFVLDGEWLSKPRTSQPCYSRFAGPSARGGLLPPMK